MLLLGIAWLSALWALAVGLENNGRIVLLKPPPFSVANGTSLEEVDTKEYFKWLKLYFGEETYNNLPCVAEQEKNGWQTNAKLPMVPYTVGVEGTGHHAIEVCEVCENYV